MIGIGSLIDLTGQQFGDWTVLSRGNKANDGHIKWLCRCSCGTEREVVGKDLKSGRSTNCGCKRNEKRSEALRKDLTNCQFGKLTALRPLQKKYKGNCYWECQCECGNIIETTANKLLSGNTKSCGCLQKLRAGEANQKDITNQKFGKLTAVEPIGKTKRSTIIWKCMCECGNTVNVAIDHLTSGNTQSCGCLQSKGEQKLKEIFQKENILYESQKQFDTCIFPDTKEKARFDFYLTEYNILIEYDGIQHFQCSPNSIWNTEEDFKKLKKRDAFKTKWCNDNNIKLIRIPYTCFKNLNSELIWNYILSN